MSVSRTIVEQINAIDRLAFFAWGVKRVMHRADGIQFKSSGIVGWKGFVEVLYDEGADLYNLNFYKVRGTTIKYTAQHEGVYAEDLVRFIDEVVK